MTTLTVDDIGQRYASEEQRQRDGVTLTWCGCDEPPPPGTTTRPGVNGRVQRANGLAFHRARYALWYGGERVVKIERGPASQPDVFIVWTVRHEGLVAVFEDHDVGRGAELQTGRATEPMIGVQWMV